MSNFPSIDGHEAIARFEAFGFRVVRNASSHYILKKEGHQRLLSIPVHGRKALKWGLLHSQIKAAGLTAEQFFERQ